MHLLSLAGMLDVVGEIESIQMIEAVKTVWSQGDARVLIVKSALTSTGFPSWMLTRLGVGSKNTDLKTSRCSSPVKGMRSKTGMEFFWDTSAGLSQATLRKDFCHSKSAAKFVEISA
jgi:hypothetical protein